MGDDPTLTAVLDAFDLYDDFFICAHIIGNEYTLASAVSALAGYNGYGPFAFGFAYCRQGMYYRAEHLQPVENLILVAE